MTKKKPDSARIEQCRTSGKMPGSVRAACSTLLLSESCHVRTLVFEHGAVEHPDWMSGLRCTNMQCGTTRCEVARTGEYLAVSCHVADRHFTIVGANGKGEVEALVAWLQAAGSSARGDKSREVS